MKSILKQLYVDENRSTRDIGKFFNVSHTTIENKLKKYGISKPISASISSMKNKKIGIKHSNEHREAISSGNKGKTRTKEHRLNYRNSKLGEKNPQHINGQYSRKTYKYIRELKEYTDWREAVFKRDNYTCKKCGVVGCKLNAHHIIPFTILIEDIKEMSKEELIMNASKFEKLWNINNGITLCEKCHYKTHGRGD